MERRFDWIFPINGGKEWWQFAQNGSITKVMHVYLSTHQIIPFLSYKLYIDDEIFMNMVDMVAGTK